MLRYLFMILRRKWINKKWKRNEEHNNMTQGNDDHQQILWHGNKRKNMLE